MASFLEDLGGTIENTNALLTQVSPIPDDVAYGQRLERAFESGEQVVTNEAGAVQNGALDQPAVQRTAG